MEHTRLNTEESADITIDEKPRSESKPRNILESCWTLNVKRRCFRIFVLLTLFAGGVAIWCVINYGLNTTDNLLISTDKKISITMTNCTLNIRQDPALDISHFTLDVNIPGIFTFNIVIGKNGYSKVFNEEYFAIEALNNIAHAEVCAVTLILNPNATLRGLSINCDGNCLISSQGPNPLNLNNGAFYLNGSHVEFMATGIIASSVNVHIFKGNIHIYSLKLTSVTEKSNLINQHGDVVIQSTNSIKVSWNQSQYRNCFYAPQIIPAGNILPECEAQINQNEAPAQCNSDYILCNKNDTCASNMLVPNIFLSADVGNVYANIIDNAGVPVDKSFNSVKGWEFTKGIEFDSSLNKTLMNFIENFNGSIMADPIIMVTLGPSAVFSSAAMDFLLVGNTAYLIIHPWLVSYLSGHLLVNRATKMEGNLAPGLCPFRTLPTTDDLVTIKRKLLQSFTLFSGKSDAGYLYMPTSKEIKNEPQVHDGFRGLYGKTSLYEIFLNNNRYEMREFTLQLRLSLMLAIVISWIIASIMAALTFYILLELLKLFAKKISNEHSHLTSYAVRAGGKEYKEKEEVQVDQVVDISLDNLDNLQNIVNMVNIVNIVNMLEAKFSVFKLSPFMIIDDFVGMIQKNYSSSVTEFIDSLFVELAPNEIDDYQPIRASELRIEYEKYCFLKQLPEENMLSDSNKKKFVKKGFKFETPDDGTKGQQVEMLIKVRWATDNDTKKSSKYDQQIVDSSLHRFFMGNCFKTAFESDTIEFTEFTQKYYEFCEKEQLESIEVTKEQLHDSFGIDFSVESPEVLVRCAGLTTYKVDFEKIKQINNNMIDQYSNKPVVKTEKMTPAELDAISKEGSIKAYFYDTIAVFLHVVAALVMSVTIIAGTMIRDLDYSDYRLDDYKYRLTYQDIASMAGNFSGKIQYFDPTTVAIFVMAACYFVISFVECLIYYWFMSFPRQSLNDSIKIRLNLFIKIIRFIVWGCILTFFSLAMLYAAMILVWAILGAILNPNLYLYYGTSAITLVTFVANKVNEFRQLYLNGIEELQNVLFSKLQGKLDDIMKKILAQAGFSAGAGAGASESSSSSQDSGSLMDKISKVAQNSSIGKTMSSLGIDPGDAIGALSNDEDSLIKIGTKQGIPENVMRLILAIIHGKKNKIITEILGFASNPTLNLDPEIAKLMIDLVTNNSDMNTNVIITKLSQILFDLALAQYKAYQGDKPKEEKPNNEKLAYLEICKQVFPMLINSFRHLKAESMDQFIEQFEEVNNNLIISLNKKRASQKSSDSNAFKDLFDKNGDPLFALPPYIMKALHIYRLIALDDTTKLKGQNFINVRNAILYIIKNFLAADQKVINILCALISGSSDELLGSDNKIMSLEEQEQIIKDIGAVFKTPTTPASLSWKIWTGNFTVNETFVDEVTRFVSEICKSSNDNSDFIPLQKVIIETILQMFSIASIQINEESIKAYASKFEVSSSVSEIVTLFGNSRMQSNQPGYKSSNALILNAISSELRLPVHNSLALISLFKADFGNKSVISLLDSNKSRWGLSDIPSNVITSILALLLSRDEHEIIKACAALNLVPMEFALTAKKLLHPANIGNSVFSNLGLAFDEDSIKYRSKIPTDQLDYWEEWIKQVKKLLSADYRNLELTIQNTPDLKDKIMTETLENPLNSQVPEVVICKKRVKRAEKEFYRAQARALLSIGASQSIDKTLILDLLAPLIRSKSLASKDCEKAADTLLVFAKGISDLQENAPDAKIKPSISKMADMFGVPVKVLNGIISIIYLRKPEEVTKGIEILLQKRISKNELEAVKMYTSFVLNQHKVLQNLEKSVAKVSDKFEIPKFLVNYMLSSQSNNTETKINIDEFMIIMNQIGLNEKSLKEHNIQFCWHNNRIKNLEELKFMISGIMVGDSNIIKKFLKAMDMPKSVQKLAFEMAADDISDSFKIIYDALSPVIKKFGISEKSLLILVEIVFFLEIILIKFKTLCGFGDKQSIDDSQENTNGFEYLKRQTGIVPEVLKCLDAVLKDDSEKLIVEIPNMIRVLCDLDLIPEHTKIMPEIVSGLLSILTGTDSSIEKLAEEIKIETGLIDLCIMIANISQFNDEKRREKLTALVQSQKFTKVIEKLKIQPEVIESLLLLTFTAFDKDSMIPFFVKLGILPHIDPAFAKFMLINASNYLQLQIPSGNAYYKESKRRKQDVNECKKYIDSICKKLNIDKNIALIGTRLRQGDFYIIEDYQLYLQPLLASVNARKLAMGICGCMTLPIKFEHKFDCYPDTWDHKTTYEGSCEMLCELMNINPIIPRIVQLDEETLKLLEENFSIPRQIIAWLIISLYNFSSPTLDALAIYSFKKRIHFKKLQLEGQLKTKLEEEKLAEEYGRTMTDPFNVTGDISITQKDDSTRLFKRSKSIKKNRETFIYYDNGIDFNSLEYENLEDLMNSDESVSVLNEILEVLLFNDKQMCSMDYDILSGKDGIKSIFS